MKKLLVLFSLLVLSAILTACEKAVEVASDDQVASGENEAETVDQYAGWKTYENADLGISFKYPEGEVGFSDKIIVGLDTGKRVRISVKGISMVITSADYALGVGEGCCYYYSGESLDMNLSDADVKAEIEKQFGEVFEFQRRRTFGGFTFIRMNEYISVQPTYSALIPFEQGGDYANILFSGPGMGNFFLKIGEAGYRADLAGAIDYINKQKYKEDIDYQNEVAVFDLIVSSFKLI